MNINYLTINIFVSREVNTTSLRTLTKQSLHLLLFVSSYTSSLKGSIFFSETNDFPKHKCVSDQEAFRYKSSSANDYPY